jgi:hypothetical protein
MGPDGVQVLLLALTNQCSAIRYSAASRLKCARSDFPRIIPALIDRFQDSDIQVHQAAVGSIGQLHAEGKLAVPALIKDFSATNTLLRTFILVSLSNFGPDAQESVPMIREALKDQNGQVKEAAAWALKKIDPAAIARAEESSGPAPSTLEERLRRDVMRELLRERAPAGK